MPRTHESSPLADDPTVVVPRLDGPPPPRPRAFALLYALLVGLPVVLTSLFIAVGEKTKQATSGIVDVERVPQPMALGSLPSLLLLLSQIGVILMVARGAGWILRKAGQPQVIGEMAAGILLGPSLLGAVAPATFEMLFPLHSLGYLNALSQVGIVLFMFVVGLELDPALMRARRHTAVLTSHASITAPFLLGTVVAFPLYPALGGPGVTFTHFALFLGAAMSVTAFPVLARILNERKLQKTHLGATAITCAAVDDVTAWCILAAVAALVRKDAAGHPLWLTIAGAVAFSAFLMTLGRKLLARLADTHEKRGQASGDLMAFVILAALGGAWITEWLGIHALFGAFLVGVAMPKHPPLMQALLHRLEEILVVVLVPLFFAFTGLRTRLGLIQGSGMWLICGMIIAAAIVGKIGGSALASRLSGLNWRESAAIGVLMNTRGLIGLVFLNVGLELGVLSPALFAMMVLMALVTTLMTTPLLALIWPSSPAH